MLIAPLLPCVASEPDVLTLSRIGASCLSLGALTQAGELDGTSPRAPFRMSTRAHRVHSRAQAPAWGAAAFARLRAHTPHQAGISGFVSQQSKAYPKY